MKPRTKNDSWCYTTSKRSARRRVKKWKNKMRRRDDKHIINSQTQEQ